MKTLAMNTNKKLAAILLFVAYLALFIITLLLIATSKVNAQVPILKLQLSNERNTDETVVYYQEGATDGFDNNYDACKMHSAGNSVFIAQEHGTDAIKINGIAPVSGNFSILVTATTERSGPHTISLTDYCRIAPGTCVKLTDLFTGTMTNLLSSDYTFTLSDTVSVPRFIFSITYSALPVVTKLVKAQCKKTNGAQFIIAGGNPGPWNYTWKDLSGNILKTSLNKNSADTISGLGYGNFSVEVQTDDGCNSGAADFFINPFPLAAFSCADTFLLNSTEEWMAFNTSEHASNFKWDFGDKSETTDETDVMHTFKRAGIYEVKLMAFGNSSCTDTAKKIITVMSSPFSAENFRSFSIEKNRFSPVFFGNEILNNGFFNLGGRLIPEKKINSTNRNFNVNYFKGRSFRTKINSK